MEEFHTHYLSSRKVPPSIKSSMFIIDSLRQRLRQNGTPVTSFCIQHVNLGHGLLQGINLYERGCHRRRGWGEESENGGGILTNL